MNLYDTYSIIRSIKAAKRIPSFLKDNYFPTDKQDIYETKKVMVDFENDTDDKLAPAVVKGSVPVQRDGFQSHEYTAPLIAPSAPLSVEQLDDRTFNESVVSDRSAQDREREYLADDLKKLGGMITRTEEYMCARTLLDNAYTINQYVDGYGTALAQPFSINFFGEGNNTNQAVYVPGATWTPSTTTILSDIAAMCRMLKKKGLPATDVIMGSQAADVFLRNTDVRALLDNRRIQLVGNAVDPTELESGATYIGRFNADGNVVDVNSYDATYVDDLTNTEVHFFDTDKIVVTAKKMGRIAYGAITQYDEGSTTAKTYPYARVPHVTINRHDGVKELALKARPLAMPRHLNAAIVADVL